MSQHPVQILMATYNAERFLDQQMRSFFAQSHEAWTLLVRDNCSTDSTPELLDTYARQHPGRVTVIHGTENLGAMRNFSRLLDHADAPYVMFSDSDDVWLPGKIENTLEAMLRCETEMGEKHPTLVHTDLTVVDSELRLLGSSYWAYQKLRPRWGTTLNRQLVQNYVTGCTVMLNRALVETARPIPDEAHMHDWWIALTAAAFGHIEVLDKQTMLYRQHGANNTGAKRRNLDYYFHRASFTPKSTRRKEFLISLNRTQLQAKAFLRDKGGKLSVSKRAIVQAFLDLQTGSNVQRRMRILKYGFFKSYPLSSIGLLLEI